MSHLCVYKDSVYMRFFVFLSMFVLFMACSHLIRTEDQMENAYDYPGTH